MKKTPVFVASVSLIGIAMLPACQNKKQEQTQKPFNIVYIMTDDHTAQMMSCYDTRYAYTPNLDRIARDGVLFTHWKPCRQDSTIGKFCPVRVIIITRNSLLQPMILLKNMVI